MVTKSHLDRRTKLKDSVLDSSVLKNERRVVKEMTMHAPLKEKCRDFGENVVDCQKVAFSD